MINGLTWSLYYKLSKHGNTKSLVRARIEIDNRGRTFFVVVSLEEKDKQSAIRLDSPAVCAKVNQKYEAIPGSEDSRLEQVSIGAVFLHLATDSQCVIEEVCWEEFAEGIRIKIVRLDGDRFERPTMLCLDKDYAAIQ